MNNSDLPAMPIGEQLDGEWLNPICNGLTKREHFAGLAMAGFASDASLELGWKESAHLAVLWADSLLAELDKDNGNG